MSATTHELTIERARLRMRLPESQLDSRAAIERVHQRVVREALELALASEHGGEELVCVRSVAISLRLDPNQSEGAWMQLWTTALTRELTELLGRADQRRVIRYPSPSAALVDMGRSLVRGDLRRGWAWAQLGFVAAGDVEFDDHLDVARAGRPKPGGAVNLVRAYEGFTRTLLGRPELIVAVMAQLGKAPELLVRLLARLGAQAATKLCSAALRVHGLASAAPEQSELLRAWSSSSNPAQDEPSDSILPSDSVQPSNSEQPSSPESAVSGRVLDLLALSSRSILADSLRQLARSAKLDAASLQITQALLIFALLDAAPMSARRLLAEADTAATLALVLARLTSERPSARARDRTATRPATSRPLASVDHPTLRTPSSTEQPANADRRGRSEPPGTPPEERLTAWRDELLDARARGESQWGGLLFTLALLRRAQLWARLDALAERLHLEFRGVLHAFGMSLVPVPIEPDDAALLAFIGLPPDAPPPQLELAPDSRPAFVEELDLVLSQLLDALDRLVPPRPHRPQRGAALLAWLLRRRTRVFGEHGWLELRFDLRDVDTDIRRAGLDLNPDWVPELGTVLRFVYE